MGSRPVVGLVVEDDLGARGQRAGQGHAAVVGRPDSSEGIAVASVPRPTKAQSAHRRGARRLSSGRLSRPADTRRSVHGHGVEERAFLEDHPHVEADRPQGPASSRPPTSTPPTGNRSRVGLEAARVRRRIVVLPEPEPPSRPLVAPRGRSKLSRSGSGRSASTVGMASRKGYSTP